ncbi:5-oxoprolinase subunit C family protein [Pararhodonellum marinum]|uniref:5-oxoprolinase subunit C family protein n=1 Tax=Pararhodonellum marinum TaxID=2755358 RepID=UPI0018906ED4|nr:biotin-dependent carboxyltransferase family protein [Pararhodonellum marinum]
MKGCQINKIGPINSIQDLGRKGFVEYGVPESGPMDLFAHQSANHLLKNKPTASSLELTLCGANLEFDKTTHMVLTGAPTELFINDSQKEIYKVHQIQAGDRVKINAPQTGQYLYLGIKGGFLTESILGSRSFFKGITSNFFLSKGMVLPYRAYNKPLQSKHAHISSHPSYLNQNTLKVYPGPESKGIDPEVWDDLMSMEFSVGKQQNRMGIQLNETLNISLPEILSAPCYPGTVQLTPSGKLIVLMRDAQVTGGYPRLFQLTSKAISILCQKRTDEKIRFKEVSGQATIPI